MKTATFYSYLPKRYTANDAHTERVRRFIYSFKRGDRHAVCSSSARSSPRRKRPHSPFTGSG